MVTLRRGGGGGVAHSRAARSLARRCNNDAADRCQPPKPPPPRHNRRRRRQRRRQQPWRSFPSAAVSVGRGYDATATTTAAVTASDYVPRATAETIGCGGLFFGDERWYERRFCSFAIKIFGTSTTTRQKVCAKGAKGCRTDGVYLLYGAAVTNKCTKLSVIGMLNRELVIHMPEMLCSYDGCCKRRHTCCVCACKFCFLIPFPETTVATEV